MLTTKAKNIITQKKVMKRKSETYLEKKGR
jgi:hypothetical protein